MTTLERLAALLHKEFGIAAETLLPEATLESLDIDSLRMLEILFSVEEEFAITVPGDHGELKARIKTLGDLAVYVDDLLSPGADSAP